MNFSFRARSVRFSTLLANVRHPGWRRTSLLRKAAALMLFAVAIASLVHARTTQVQPVVVFARQVDAGAVITAEDLTTAPIPERFLPEDARPEPENIADIEGMIATSTMSRGEVLSFSKVLSDPQNSPVVITNTENNKDSLLNLVPLHLAHPELAELLHPGDIVDVVIATDEGQAAQIIAAGGRVVLVDRSSDKGGSHSSPKVLLSLPADQARDVATASLGTPLAVVITGARAQG